MHGEKVNNTSVTSIRDSHGYLCLCGGKIQNKSCSTSKTHKPCNNLTHIRLFMHLWWLIIINILPALEDTESYVYSSLQKQACIDSSWMYLQNILNYCKSTHLTPAIIKRRAYHSVTKASVLLWMCYATGYSLNHDWMNLHTEMLFTVKQEREYGATTAMLSLALFQNTPCIHARLTINWGCLYIRNHLRVIFFLSKRESWTESPHYTGVRMLHWAQHVLMRGRVGVLHVCICTCSGALHRCVYAKWMLMQNCKKCNPYSRAEILATCCSVFVITASHNIVRKYCIFKTYLCSRTVHIVWTQNRIVVCRCVHTYGAWFESTGCNLYVCMYVTSQDSMSTWPHMCIISFTHPHLISIWYTGLYVKAWTYCDGEQEHGVELRCNMTARLPGLFPNVK